MNTLNKKNNPKRRATVFFFLLFIIIVASLLFFFNQYQLPPNKTASKDINTSSVAKNIKWRKGMVVTVKNNIIRLQANGIPNHKRDAQYILPQAGVIVPDKSTAIIADDPTKEQDYDFKITTKPKLASTITKAPLGSIGLMISGAVLFNPYEGDDKTLAMANNFYLLDDNGNKVWFVDSCSGHPTPTEGEYHYHALSNCVASKVDEANGPSHIIGIALDGFFIYGANDINGNKVPVSSLDECNGITSPTPEFPDGMYHYVLPGTSDETSSIRCFKGEVDITQIMEMPPMGPPQKN